VSARIRIVVLVAVSAALAAGAAIGVAVVQSEGGRGSPGEAARPEGDPPLVLDLGVRDDAEAGALRRAAMLYARGERAAAADVFARHESVDARVGAALARWPEGTVAELERLRRDHPDRAVVRLNLGFALFWAGRRDEAVEEWREARRVEPDSLAAVRAEDLLYPNFPRGRPTFVPGFDPPAEISRLPADRQLAALERAAAAGGAHEKLLYGVALQRVGRPVSARRQFEEAAGLEPADAEAATAVAVAHFDKEAPEEAFSRLGPLADRFPGDPAVRFHLGLLLLWIGDLDSAKRQLTLARESGSATAHGREAQRFLDRLADVGEDGDVDG
jgi:tetratricopeptide (TPR) repeat protein